MRITGLRLANWRNFKNIDVPMSERVLIFGPNASGKSNLLDSVRFLRDLTTSPGGLQYAVESRGGMRHVRFLNARRNNDGCVTVAARFGDDDDPRLWEYELTFTAEKSGQRRPIVRSERVLWKGKILRDWNAADESDPELATQTGMEQVGENAAFRDLSTFLEGVEYLHLVPQVVRDPVRHGAIKRDPFGGTFLSEIGRASKKDFERRRKVMERALKVAVPQFESLDRTQDKDGTWHLEARYRHFRPNASAQNERDFSDGTLRLIGLLWVLTDREPPQAPVLLEEPELSLHAEIMRIIPAMLQRASAAAGRQVIASSHGTVMLEDPTLSPDDVLLLSPGTEGTVVSAASQDATVVDLVSSGDFTVLEALRADLVLPEIGDLLSLKMA